MFLELLCFLYLEKPGPKTCLHNLVPKHLHSSKFTFLVLRLLELIIPPYAASLLLGMNDGRSDKSSRQRSGSPFSFPRQKRSVRPRLYLSIDSDSE